MTRDETKEAMARFAAHVERVKQAIHAVQDTGHGSVEVIIQDGKILDIVKKERERIA